MAKSTMVELVEELERLPRCVVRDAILARAREGAYHDFKSELPAPKVQCVEDLRRGGYKELAKRVIDGEFDEPADDTDIEAMRAEVRQADPKFYEELVRSGFFDRKGT